MNTRHAEDVENLTFFHFTLFHTTHKHINSIPFAYLDYIVKPPSIITPPGIRL